MLQINDNNTTLIWYFPQRDLVVGVARIPFIVGVIFLAVFILLFIFHVIIDQFRAFVLGEIEYVLGQRQSREKRWETGEQQERQGVELVPEDSISNGPGNRKIRKEVVLEEMMKERQESEYHCNRRDTEIGPWDSVSLCSKKKLRNTTSQGRVEYLNAWKRVIGDLEVKGKAAEDCIACRERFRYDLVAKGGQVGDEEWRMSFADVDAWLLSPIGEEEGGVEGESMSAA